MIENLPDGWRVEKLGNDFISEIIMGQSPASSSYNSNKEGLPFYQGKKDFGKNFIWVLAGIPLKEDKSEFVYCY